ncbi:HTH-type transcriptional regulator malT domain protein, partial [Vibrio parahaemolyticus IDH02640]
TGSASTTCLASSCLTSVKHVFLNKKKIFTAMRRSLGCNKNRHTKPFITHKSPTIKT